MRFCNSEKDRVLNSGNAGAQKTRPSALCDSTLQVHKTDLKTGRCGIFLRN